MAVTPGGLAGSVVIVVAVLVTVVSIVVLQGMAQSCGGSLSFSGVHASLMQHLVPLGSPLDPTQPLPSAYKGSLQPMKGTKAIQRKVVGNSTSGSCTVGIATLLKNENHVLAEWLEHYLAEVSTSKFVV
jgi:hypothetical protein